MIRFLQRHPSVGRYISRGLMRSWVSRRVWTELERDPAFTASMAEGTADVAAGRVTELVRMPDPGQVTEFGRVVLRTVAATDEGYTVQLETRL